MSKRETPMTRWYWRQVGGTLCEEFLAVPGSKTAGQRLLDRDPARKVFPRSPTSRRPCLTVVGRPTRPTPTTSFLPRPFTPS